MWTPDFREVDDVCECECTCGDEIMCTCECDCPDYEIEGEDYFEGMEIVEWDDDEDDEG